MATVAAPIQRAVAPLVSFGNVNPLLKAFAGAATFFLYGIIIGVLLLGLLSGEAGWSISLSGGIALAAIVAGFAAYFKGERGSGLFPYKYPSLDITIGMFVMTYILAGMYNTQNWNAALIIIYAVIFVATIVARLMGEMISAGNLSLSLLLGLMLSAIYSLVIMSMTPDNMIFAGSKKGADRCGQTRNRNFKCSVYKNGVLLKQS
jgi:hypothetical protein